MLHKCGRQDAVLPPTHLYNESWLLALTLDWYGGGTHQAPGGLKLFPDGGGTWRSEAILPSQFPPTARRDGKGEHGTHADAVIGDTELEHTDHGYVGLKPGAAHFVVVEAKMGSPLSAGVANADYYDQAARTVACMANVVQRWERDADKLDTVGFYVLAPQEHIDRGRFASQLNPASITEKVRRRAAGYGGDATGWYHACFVPFLRTVQIGQVSWEQLIQGMGERDPQFATSMNEFYRQCMHYNRVGGTTR